MKKIIFLFSGNARTFPFNNNQMMRKKQLLESYNKYIFTDKFKNLYEYRVYITTDNIHLEDTINYFSSNNIGNIHLLDTEFYLKQIDNKIPNVAYYLDKYNKHNFKTYCKYYNSVYQHHKILDCYNLITSDVDLKSYDYIVRMRMDTEICMDILDVLALFEKNPELEIVLHWDVFAVGKCPIMNKYCSGLNNAYGTYDYKLVPNNFMNLNEPLLSDSKRWVYAPEIQLFQLLIEYCEKNNLKLETVINVVNFCVIVR